MITNCYPPGDRSFHIDNIDIDENSPCFSLKADLFTETGVKVGTVGTTGLGKHTIEFLHSFDQVEFEKWSEGCSTPQVLAILYRNYTRTH